MNTNSNITKNDETSSTSTYTATWCDNCGRYMELINPEPLVLCARCEDEAMYEDEEGTIA